MQFFKFVILSITRILDELSFVLVDVILGYRHQVMHRSHELALDDHFSHPEEIGIGLPVVIHAFGADVEILVALFPTAHIPEAVPLQIKFDSPLLTCHADHFVASKRQPRLFESLVHPEPEAENTDAPEGKTSETVSGASAPTAERTDANTQTSDVKELAGFRRKKIPLPDFERTFFAPADCRNRSAIYISAATKYKVSAILHLLGMRIQGLQLWSTICCAL